MGSMSTFQLLVIGAFIILAIVGVGAFAVFGGALGGSGVGPVVVWGTRSQDEMTTLIESLRSQNKAFEQVTYVEKDPSTYTKELVSAMAAGTGPDLFLIDQENLGAFVDKVGIIPYGAISQGTFANSYIDEGQVFLSPQGAYALPFLIDPMVMYWNRDLFAQAGLGQPPTLWSDFTKADGIPTKISAIDTSQNVKRSAVAMGAWDNVANAKAILSTLFMQSGDPIVGRDSSTGNLISVFGRTPSAAAENPASSALRFYTEFADPGKSTYSWNRALPLSTNAFVAGDVGVYFGFASEYQSLLQRNPNLHFGVDVVPQLQNAPQMTYGLLTGVAISRTAHNVNGALVIAEALTAQTASAVEARTTGLPPARRDVQVDTSGNAAAATFVRSALIARGWLDPDPASTNSIFKGMINSVVSGASTPDAAVSDASQEMSQLFTPNAQ
ncbi:MAG: extracellular solute-binding protein [Patescibacteria group bacterium]|nr:extracellular solute-binding protein [Patescibacteria group bacterium]